MCSTCEASPEAAASMCGSIADPHLDGRGFFAVSYHPCHRRKRPDKTRTIMSPSIVIQYSHLRRGERPHHFSSAIASSRNTVPSESLPTSRRGTCSWQLYVADNAVIDRHLIQPPGRGSSKIDSGFMHRDVEITGTIKQLVQQIF